MKPHNSMFPSQDYPPSTLDIYYVLSIYFIAIDLIALGCLEEIRCMMVVRKVFYVSLSYVKLLLVPSNY